MTKKAIVLGLVLFSTILLGACGSTDGAGETGDRDPVAPVSTVPSSDASGDAPTATLEPGSRAGALEEILPVDYPDALSARNQLALGTLRLEETENAVAAEQAQNLAFLWQALMALTADSTSAPEEMTAVQTQIVASMSPAQLEAIQAMALTNADLTEFYVEHGVVINTPEPGVTPQGGGGRNSGVSTEDREATRTAAEALGTPVGTGGGGTGSDRRDILLDVLISLLNERAGD